MENVNRWYFTKDQLANTPSSKCLIDPARELSYRQQAANFIQDMGQRLQVSQLCINTAIVYMHRFYVFHSFTEVHRNSLSVAALFLAAKVEEQPRKLEHVIKVAHVCLHKDLPALDVRTEAYQEKQFEVVAHENVLLQTLGFVLAIEHPHTYVVKVCQLVKASKDLAQTSYFMATTSLHMTTMCLQYRPTVVACVCIHLACKWSSWKIEPCSEGKEWYYYVDKSVTLELLETLTQEFIAILETSPHRFKRKFKDGSGYHGPKNIMDDSSNHGKQLLPSENKIGLAKKDTSPGPSTSLSFNLCDIEEKTVIKVESTEKNAVPSVPSSPPPPVKVKAEPSHSISLAVYREKREKERLEHKSSAVPSETSVHQPGINKPQHAFNEHERLHHKTVNKQLEMPSHSSKGSKVSVVKEPQLQPTSRNKVNHQLPKTNSDVCHSKELKHTASHVRKNSVTNDPVVVLERVDAKSEFKKILPDSELRISQPTVSTDKSMCITDKGGIHDGDLPNSPELPPVNVRVAENAQLIKHKHPKHKPNSSLLNVQAPGPSLPQSPAKDVKTNGSKETDNLDRKVHVAVENNVAVKSTDTLPSKHERREKHRSKHSHSSKDKSVSNHSENTTPGIKVKIRKDVICLSGTVPESSQKSQSSVKSESPKKSIKIKISKPPIPEPPKVEKSANPASIKLVITKDKSGSGSYSTSHKNERESRKRVHSPASQDPNCKNFYEPSTKYIKGDHSHKSHHSDGSNAITKHGKVSRHGTHRSSADLHVSNDTSIKLQHQMSDPAMYNNLAGRGYVDPYFPHYFPFQVTPPPPPPVLRGHGPLIGKTNSNPPLPPPLPPQPPPPPPE